MESSILQLLQSLEIFMHGIDTHIFFAYPSDNMDDKTLISSSPLLFSLE
jgi:hypothetical protein